MEFEVKKGIPKEKLVSELVKEFPNVSASFHSDSGKEKIKISIKSKDEEKLPEEKLILDFLQKLYKSLEPKPEPKPIESKPNPEPIEIDSESSHSNDQESEKSFKLQEDLLQLCISFCSVVYKYIEETCIKSVANCEDQILGLKKEVLESDSKVNHLKEELIKQKDISENKGLDLDKRLSNIEDLMSGMQVKLVLGKSKNKEEKPE